MLICFIRTVWTLFDQKQTTEADNLTAFTKLDLNIAKP